ncbi:MAG: hypothetical protein IKJ69_03285 [Clostridia bacterium]|nr:hypothetical protein [Clostridia bacterium]
MEFLSLNGCWQGECFDADIYLNNTLVGSVDNMFISYSFDVAGILNKGEHNLVLIVFTYPRG